MHTCIYLAFCSAPLNCWRRVGSSDGRRGMVWGPRDLHNSLIHDRQLLITRVGSLSSWQRWHTVWATCMDMFSLWNSCITPYMYNTIVLSQSTSMYEWHTTCNSFLIGDNSQWLSVDLIQECSRIDLIYLEEFTVVSVAEPPGQQLNAMEGRVTRGGGGRVWFCHINQSFN